MPIFLSESIEIFCHGQIRWVSMIIRWKKISSLLSYLYDFLSPFLNSCSSEGLAWIRYISPIFDSQKISTLSYQNPYDVIRDRKYSKNMKKISRANSGGSDSRLKMDARSTMSIGSHSWRMSIYPWSMPLSRRSRSIYPWRVSSSFLQS